MCNVLPYCELDGIPTLRDSDLLHLYDRMDAEGAAVSAYPYGREHWLAEIKSRRSLLYVVLVNHEPGGMLWLNDFRGRYAHVHLVVFKEFHGRSYVDNGRSAVKTVLDGRDAKGQHIFDGFIGMIPEWNRLAIAYALRCGFKQAGVIPFGHYDHKQNQSVPAVLLALAREGLSDE